jgi:hypothetical protein
VAAPAQPPAASAEPLDTVDAALAALNRAEGDLDRVFGPAGGNGAVPSGTAAVPPSPQDARQMSDEPAGDPCTIACLALASMERAADHLCSMIVQTEPDVRCIDAHRRVDNARSRVHAHCTCKG